MPETSRVFTPSRTYDIQVKIKDLDYTNDISSVEIKSSLSTAYQIVQLVFNVDPTDIINNDLFGGDPIKLSVTLLRQSTYPGPRIDFELMYVSSIFQFAEKDELSSQTFKDRSQLLVTTVTRKPYKTMASMINKVYLNSTLSTIISDLVSEAGGTVEYDSAGQNTTPIEQVCIPPTTLYKLIKEYNPTSNDIFDGYLDQRFGLFNGVSGVFCQYDNKLYIKNLTEKLKKDQTFTVYHLATKTDKKKLDEIFTESLSGKTFYTYDSLTTDYNGNAVFSNMGTNINHITRPKNTLYNIVSQDLSTIAKNNSLFYVAQSQTSLFTDSNVNRTRYFTEDTGNNDDETIFNARVGKTLANLSSLSLNLEKNLPLLNLINVGECVKFKPLTVEYNPFEGKYILWSSDIRFVRSGDWASTAKINLIRTNKKV